jgi:hypothetical protein
MGKLSAEAKKKYFEKIKEYKSIIEDMQRKEKSVSATISADENGAEFKKLMLSDEVLNRTSFYILMNSLSVSLLGVKNEAFLNDARKDLYKSIIYLEETVTSYIDVPYSDYEENVEKIESFDDEKRYKLAQKLGFSIHTVKDGFGANTKWKWSFVELEARLATVTKNLLNLKTFVAGLDPRVPGYETRLAHLDLTKKLLHQAADRYREKYELSTLRIDDFQLAINYLSALRRLHILLGEPEESEQIKKKIDVWKAKLEADARKSDKKKSSSP